MNFFLICPLNFEKIVETELLHKFQLYFEKKPNYTLVDGGIEIECLAEEGLQLNYILKTPTRILLRIKEQKCRDFPKLYKIIQRIDWKKYTKRTDLNWSITTKESRLINTKKMEETCNEAVQKYFNANSLSQKIIDQKEVFQKQTVFIRVNKDLIQISLDTSGDSLHVRGGEKFRGQASIRSTIASCLLVNFLYKKQDIHLIDPMCGSGTFIKEALNFHKLNYNRSYAFEDIVKFERMADSSHLFEIKSIAGFDNNHSIIKRNDQRIFKVRDVFSHKISSPNKYYIILNPPYGKRVKLNRPRNLYYTELISSVQKNLNAQEISIIIPTDIKIEVYKSRIKFFNSGIWLYNYII